MAAVRYFLVKFSRGKVIAFDIDEALSFEGETGPYLQYAVVRANNIFTKLGSATASTRPSCLSGRPAPDRDPHGRQRRRPTSCGGSCSKRARLDEVVEQAVRTLELSVLAKYAFGLAQAFNAFYHR